MSLFLLRRIGCLFTALIVLCTIGCDQYATTTLDQAVTFRQPTTGDGAPVPIGSFDVRGYPWTLDAAWTLPSDTVQNLRRISARVALEPEGPEAKNGDTVSVDPALVFFLREPVSEALPDVRLLPLRASTAGGKVDGSPGSNEAGGDTVEDDPPELGPPSASFENIDQPSTYRFFVLVPPSQTAPDGTVSVEIETEDGRQTATFPLRAVSLTAAPVLDVDGSMLRWHPDGTGLSVDLNRSSIEAPAPPNSWIPIGVARYDTTGFASDPALSFASGCVSGGAAATSGDIRFCGPVDPESFSYRLFLFSR
jgi:hypothetical protein